MKAKWNVLRSGYNQARKKLPSGSGAPEKSLKPWEYFESMSFLNDFLEPCEDVLSVPLSGKTLVEVGSPVEQETVDLETIAERPMISIRDSAGNTYTNPYLETDAFIHPESSSSFLIDYPSSPSQGRI